MKSYPFFIPKIEKMDIKLNPKFDELNIVTKLHHAKKDLEEDIPKIVYKTTIELFNDLSELFRTSEATVFLVSISKNIVVFDDWFIGERLLQTLIANSHEEDCFVFEFYSYEEAYNVALSIKEESPLCYEPDEEEKASNKSD